jgi:hypothetical protein
VDTICALSSIEKSEKLKCPSLPSHLIKASCTTHGCTCFIFSKEEYFVLVPSLKFSALVFVFVCLSAVRFQDFKNKNMPKLKTRENTSTCISNSKIKLRVWYVSLSKISCAWIRVNCSVPYTNHILVQKSSWTHQQLLFAQNSISTRWGTTDTSTEILIHNFVNTIADDSIISDLWTKMNSKNFSILSPP